MVDCAPTGRLIGLQGAGQLEALFAFSGSACAALPAPPPLASRDRQQRQLQCSAVAWPALVSAVHRRMLGRTQHCSGLTSSALRLPLVNR
jgi:hypothetical protein